MSKWLLLTHRLPSRPSNVRVKVWRQLQIVGAIPIKNSIYILPNLPDTREDFEWLRKEILTMKGHASLFLSDTVTESDDKDIVGAFQQARTREITNLIQDISDFQKRVRALLKTRHASEDAWNHSQNRWVGLRAAHDRIVKVDFFKAPNREELEAVRKETVALIEGAKNLSRKGNPVLPPIRAKDLKGRLWVTRTSPHIDRLASAWLIKKFIDTKARFTFVKQSDTITDKSVIRYDMYEADFTHAGDWCTFETLLHRLRLKDPVVRDMAKIIHDIDLKDSKFRRPEAAGVALAIGGLCETYADDFQRLKAGIALFDLLYTALACQRRNKR